jgi:multidrug efflux system membrane fusion protein
MPEQVSISERPVPRPTETAPAGEKPPRKHYALLLIGVAVVIAVVIALPMLLSKKAPPRRVPPVTISTTNAVQGNIDVAVPALGTVTPVYTAMISPRVDGQVIKVDYQEGQLVRSNDLLAEIDSSPYVAIQTEAEGQLARDKAILEGANIDLQRYEDAYKKKAIPQQQVDDQKATVHQDEGTVKYDEGQVAAAKVQVAYCYIRAPFDGRVGLRLVDPGNIVHAANTNALVVEAQLQPITVVFSPSEDYLPQIERQLLAHHQMTVEAWDRDEKEKIATGKFLTTDTQIDTATGTIRIRAIFDNGDMALFPNQFVNVKLIVDTLTNVMLVPTAAIQRNPQGAFVYLVNHQTVTITNQTGPVTTNQTVVTMHNITTGVVDGDTTQVEGLEPDAEIAADNFNKLGDKMKVNVRQAGAEGQKGGAPGPKKRRPSKDAPQGNQS